MEDSQPAQENGRGVKKNMNSYAKVMYIHVPFIVYRCCDVYLYISEKSPR
jgi:coproporphyrinogen III oxidase-like Fe-S oxidoreductase